MDLNDSLCKSTIIAKNLNRLLSKHNFSQREVATKAHLNASVVHRICTGHTSNPQINTLRKIALALEVSLSEILDSEINGKE